MEVEERDEEEVVVREISACEVVVYMRWGMVDTSGERAQGLEEPRSWSRVGSITLQAKLSARAN